MILSNAPPSSVDERPPEPREPTTVPTSSLEALPISVELKPASSRLAMDVEVILLRTVSVAVDPDSAEALGNLSLLPLMDLTRLLTMTLMTLIVSDEFESPTVASFPCDPSMILGMIWMRSSELSRLAAVTAAVAASTTEVIWELVRVLESVLLVLRDETRDCLELLVEERLALSSRITVEAREVVVVPVSVVPVSDVVEEESLPEPSSLLVQPWTRINDSNRTENEKRFEKVSFRTLLYLKINLSIFNTYRGI